MPSFAHLVGVLVLATTSAASAVTQGMSLRGRRTELMEYEAVMGYATPQCFIENGWDYVGNDYSNVPGSVDQCCDKCFNLRGCSAWSWSNLNGGTCWLKTGEITKVQANPNVKSALLFTGSRPRCELLQDYDFVGNDIGNVKSSSAEGCCSICQGYAGCRSYSWSDLDGGTCWLKGPYNGQVQYKKGVKSALAYPVQDSLKQCSSALADTDFVGNDIGNQQNTLLGRCCDLCRATDGCRAFSHTIDNGGTCYLKSGVGQKIFKQGVASGQVWPNVDAKCSSSSGVDYAGQDIGNAASPNAESCCTQCRQFNGCRAWTWTNYNGGTCWYKSGNYFPVNNSGAVSGTIDA